jgi:hypothetical protein
MTVLHWICNEVLTLKKNTTIIVVNVKKVFIFGGLNIK